MNPKCRHGHTGQFLGLKTKLKQREWRRGQQNQEKQPRQKSSSNLSGANCYHGAVYKDVAMSGWRSLSFICLHRWVSEGQAHSPKNDRGKGKHRHKERRHVVVCLNILLAHYFCPQGHGPNLFNKVQRIQEQHENEHKCLKSLTTTLLLLVYFKWSQYISDLVFQDQGNLKEQTIAVSTCCPTFGTLID